MIRAFALLCLTAQSAHAFELTLPARAVEVAREVATEHVAELAIGPFEAGQVPKHGAEGDLLRRVWRLDSPGITTSQVFDPLRDQILAADYEIIFSCVARSCGGFDFRFGVEGFRAPDMFVDLSDYAYLAARRATGETDDYVAILASRSAQAGYVEVTQIGSSPPIETIAVQPGPTPTPTETGSAQSFPERFEADGRVVLDGLVFQTGSSDLANAVSPALTALADYMRRNPERTIALVGHTDSQGSLQANIALSKRRAQSVLERLATTYEIPRSQLRAEGMGYLAPLASNLTEEGRQMNRRVEAIITSIE